jgi:hypothetical protein
MRVAWIHTFGETKNSLTNNCSRFSTRTHLYFPHTAILIETPAYQHTLLVSKHCQANSVLKQDIPVSAENGWIFMIYTRRQWGLKRESHHENRDSQNLDVPTFFLSLFHVIDLFVLLCATSNMTWHIFRWGSHRIHTRFMYFSLENIHKILATNTAVQDVHQVKWQGNQDIREDSLSDAP